MRATTVFSSLLLAFAAACALCACCGSALPALSAGASCAVRCRAEPLIARPLAWPAPAFHLPLALVGPQRSRTSAFKWVVAMQQGTQGIPLAIDVRQTGAPISKYIYGQFIEHLGRCIYGGIWAEMIEDRKFFYLPGEEQSPWKLLPETKLQMDEDKPFVGAHTPIISAPGGIVQENLGVVAGKEYVGYVWVKYSGGETAAEISLIWGENAGDKQTAILPAPAGEYKKRAFRFRPPISTDNAKLEIRARGQGKLYVGVVSLMPGDNIQGMRADTLALLRELNAPIYRWPGGNFVSGYNWKDGIGERDRRPPRKNPAWKGIEHNDFGLDEFIAFCRLVGAEPYIVVNSGLGDAQSAAQEVEYANGAPDTPMGRLRAENGHPEPYRVKWWGIGNEMYGKWQLGHMPLEQYVRKHNRFAQAMRAVDPTIKLIAVGQHGPWSEGMLRHCADYMDLISEHFYRHNKQSVVEHVRQIPAAIREKVAAHRKYRTELASLKGKDIRIAMDEWNYWYGEEVYGQLGVRYHLKDALGIAAGLHEFARQSDIVFMANYAQTVNVIGCIKTTKTSAAFATTGLVLKLYRGHFGTIPVAASAQEPLDVAAALSENGKTLTIGVVNPTATPAELSLNLRGAQLARGGEKWEIAGDDPMAYNEPGKPPRVQITHENIDSVADTLSVAPYSVTLLSLPLQ